MKGRIGNFALLAILLIGTAYAVVHQVPTLLAKQPNRELLPVNMYNRAVLDMIDVIDTQIPQGTTITIAGSYVAQTVFLDKYEHEWKSASPDAYWPKSRTFSLARWCVGNGEHAKCQSAQYVVWLKLYQGCNGHYVSSQTALRRIDRQGSDYLLLTQRAGIVNILPWGEALAGSQAFDIVHSSYLGPSDPPARANGLILLKTTGSEPQSAPLVIDSTSFNNLVHCVKQEVNENYEVVLRRMFPRGVDIKGTGPVTTKARRKANKIFSTD